MANEEAFDRLMGKGHSWPMELLVQRLGGGHVYNLSTNAEQSMVGAGEGWVRKLFSLPTVHCEVHLPPQNQSSQRSGSYLQKKFFTAPLHWVPHPKESGYRPVG